MWTTTITTKTLVQSLTSTAAVSAFLSTGLISLVPNIILFLFPVLLKQQQQQQTTNTQGGGGIWQWGQCLAAGGLLGDVFLHTLPHVIMQQQGGGGREHSHQPHNNNNYDEDNQASSIHHHGNDGDTAGLWILAGFGVFFIVDVVLRMTEDWVHQQQDDGDATPHQHHQHRHDSHAQQQGQDDNNNNIQCNGTATTTTTTKTTQKATTNHDSHETNHRKSWSLIVLNLTADALHNFTDGLAIGASYAATAAASSSHATAVVSPGSVATLSILLHEVPHELGDYCTLVAGGYTPWQAVRTQFITAVAAFCGTAVALVVSFSNDESDNHGNDNNNKDALVLATAGGFLYLGGTTLLPHVLAEPVQQPWHRLGHVVAFGIGLAFMYSVALLEDVEDHHHDHHHGDVGHVEL